MNATFPESPLGQNGLHCRPAIWMDVAKFFVFNYALHAFTVVSRPGAGFLYTIVDGLTAILLPFSGTLRALLQLCRLTIFKKSKLVRAVEAGALCMVVPSSTDFGGNVSLSLTAIHGQYPVHTTSFFTWIKRKFIKQPCPSRGSLPFPEMEIDITEYKLVTVPAYFDVRPMSSANASRRRDIDIACNYSFLKTSAAIIQIIYGSYEVYAAARRSNQLDRFGYAAYSLTVVPYVLMSFLNLLAALSQGSYPSMYLMYYCGYKGPENVNDRSQNGICRKSADPPSEHIDEIADPKPTGADSSGEPQNNEPATQNPHDRIKKRMERLRVQTMKELTPPEIELVNQARDYIVGAVGCAYGLPVRKYNELLSGRVYITLLVILYYTAIAAPYLITFSLTRYHPRESTTSQRLWITSSMVFGQVGWMLIFYTPLRVLVFPENTIPRVPQGDAISRWESIRLWLTSPTHSLLGLLLYTTIMSVPAVGSFVVVARMILQDQVCVKV